MKRLCFLALVIVLSPSIPLISQTSNAAISGSVLDPMNAAVANAKRQKKQMHRQTNK